MTRTTSTVALTATAKFITLASVTNLATTSLIRMGDEYMRPVTIDTTSLVVEVQRGVNGTRGQTHGATEPTYFGTPDEFSSVFGEGRKLVPTSQITTAGAVTLTAGQVKAGLILRDPNGGARTDTLPTAALLAAAFPNLGIDEPMDFIVQNDADASEVITIAVGSGGTLQSTHTATIAQSNSKRFRFRFTSKTPGAEAYTLYNLGTFVT